ncbi:MAG TPA: ABC transporter permease [Burkholderiaceae bacterium]|nr:ABC transporter permease [Burkholderiaceae bacterium]
MSGVQPVLPAVGAGQGAQVPDGGASGPVTGWLGFRTLFQKEVLRFWKVSFQTIAAPVLTALLYLLVFGHALEAHVEAFPGVRYSAFLIPGLAMMSVLQNAFANSSSSLVQSKVMGNLVFLLLPPLSNLELFCAYVGSSILRGVVVGAGVLLVAGWIAPPPLAAPLWILAFAVAGAALLGVLGLIAGIVCDKFDQLAAFQNFVIMPATFLSGVFYSVNGLAPFWHAVSRLNPFFYAIDGFRYGFFARSDVDPLASFAVMLLALAIASSVALGLLRSGYKLRG